VPPPPTDRLLHFPGAGRGPITGSSSGARTPPTPHGPIAPPPTPAAGLAQSAVDAGTPTTTMTTATTAAMAEPPPDRAAWTLKQWHAAALAPTVARAERDEYVAYLTYPLALPLVTHAAREGPRDGDEGDGGEDGRKKEGEDGAPDEDEDDGRYAELRAYVGRVDAVVGGGVAEEVPEDLGAGPEGEASGRRSAAAAAAAGDDADAWWLDDDADDDAAEEAALRRLAGYGVEPEAVADYLAFLALAQERDPLTVRAGDGGRKRYKAYRQWLKGRSFFKLGKFDAEFQG
jgi:hypothetical protein